MRKCVTEYGALVSTAIFAVLAPTPMPAATKAGADGDAISEIIVTAQRRSERLEDVPASVTAVTSATIQNAGITRIEDLGRVVPGLVVSRTGNVQQPAIRGISILITGSGQEPNVGAYVDGYYQDSTTHADALAAVSDIQVLKGPQGSLYGRNATGGAILITTPEPTGELSANMTASYASYDDVRLKGNVNVPLGDKLALALSGAYQHNGGYLKDISGYGGSGTTFPNQQTAISASRRPAPFTQKAYRIKLKYSPSDIFSSTLGVNYVTNFDPIQVTYVQYQRVLLAGLNASFGQPVATQRDMTSLTFPTSYTTHAHEYTWTNVIQTGDIGTLTTRTRYAESHYTNAYDFDGTPFNASYNGTRQFKQLYTQAVDYEYKGIEGLDVVLGGEYYKASYKTKGVSRSQSTTPPFAFGPTTVSWNILRTKAWAAYVDGTYEAARHLFLTGGVRYSWERKFARLENPVGTRVVAQGYPPSKSWGSVTFRAAARYEFAPNANVYASFSQGFKSGTINTVGSPIIVEPEKINAYEVGVKAARWGLNGNVSAYHYDYRNLQVQSLITSTQVSLTNAASAKVDGVEAQVQGRVTKALSIRAGVNYMHARYDKYPIAQAIGVNAAGFNSTTLLQSWSGVQLPRAPMWSGNIGADYTIDDAIPGKLVGTVDVTLSSALFPSNPSYFAAVPNAYRYRQSKYALANATLTWTDDDNRISLGVFAENLTNTRYKVTNTGSTFGDYRMYNWPRVVGVRFGLKTN